MRCWLGTKPTVSVSFVFVLLCLLTCSACSNETKTISGKVADESGNALNDVTVWACHSGWGWGEEGYLVWDKNYCSETTQTKSDGSYVITFKGPVSSYLRATKQGWVQTRDFNTTQTNIVLTSSEDYSARLRAKASKRDQEHHQRQDGETETDYYCRVIFPEFRPVTLGYPEGSIAITPAFLMREDRVSALFAVQSSSANINGFAREAILKLNDETRGNSFSITVGESGCDRDVNFLEVMVSDPVAWQGWRIEVLVPSVKAMIEVDLHPGSAHQYSEVEE
jgi:hypothetical protein